MPRGIRTLSRPARAAPNDAAAELACDIGLGPIKVGTLTFKGVSFPQAAGHIEGVPQTELFLPVGLPPFATETTTTLEVASADGTPMICVKLFTKPQ